jgi:long-chain acyl-CoA synthetase
MNIARNFVFTAERLPDKVFLVGADNVAHTYSAVLRRSQRFASLLSSRGIKAGDRIILTFPNSAEYLTAYLGVLMLGCTAVPVDFRARPQHLDYVRADTEAVLWVTSKLRPEYELLPGQLIFPGEEDLDGYPEQPTSELCPNTNPLALIMFTSGATGIPKGVCLSHANLQHTIRSITSWAHVEESDRELTSLSLTHLFGLAHCHIYWTLGGTLFLEERLKDIPRLMRRIDANDITSFPGTPGGFKLILDQFADLFARRARRLKYIIVNSAPMERAYIQKLLDILPNTRLYMYYGLTEASRSSYICFNDHRDKLTTVGRATPGVDICVGTPSLPVTNEMGEIHIRGPHVTKGYLGIDSAPFFENGWFKTGDLGVMDSDGFLTWRGRLKEQINVDGLKLTPAEVESVLEQHRRVRDVAVVGAPDPHTGECVVAFVVTDGEPTKALETELRKYCKAQLEIYKVPARVVFVDSIPRTDTGKVQRLSLRERLL